MPSFEESFTNRRIIESCPPSNCSVIEAMGVSALSLPNPSHLAMTLNRCIMWNLSATLAKTSLNIWLPCVEQKNASRETLPAPHFLFSTTTSANIYD